MNQSRLTSFRESCTNTAWGFALSLAAQAAFLPVIGVSIALWQNFVFAIFMTGVSIGRGYVIRRWFEKKRMSFRVTRALVLVLAERQRQIDVEGHTPEHDVEKNKPGDLGLAAAAYFMSAARTFRGFDCGDPPACFPFNRFWWKPRRDDVQRDLVRANALGLAELERFDNTRERDDRDCDHPRPHVPLPPVSDDLRHPPYAHGKTRSEHAGSSA
jgi:hypothetical protein